MSSQPENYISLGEAVKLCDYTQGYLSLRARQGKLKAVKLGRNWVTTKDWLDDYVQRATEYNNVNGNGNGKAKEKKVLLPPDDLPVGELQFRKTGFRERLYELRFNLKPDIQNIRSALVAALVISLIMAGGIFGKGSLTQVYDDASPIVKKVHDNFQEGLSVVDGKIDQRLLAIDSKLADYGSLLNNAGLAAVEKVAGQTIPVEGQQVTVRATLAGAAEIWHGYSEWISGELLAFWGDIKNSTVGRTYITLNNSIEEGLTRDFNSIKTFYVSANTETQDFLFPLCRGIVQGYSKANDAATEALRGMGRGIKNGYVSANNFLDEKIGGGVEVAKNSLKKIKDIVTAPWGEEKIVIEPETEDLSQAIKELRSELEQLKKEPFVVKRVEVERVVEQVQEITKTIETTERTVDEEALAQVWSDIEYLEQEMAKRLYAPGGVISQTIYVTEPVRSPKIYQENGEIVLQTTGSGNIILSAATGLQLYGSQVVINSTSLLNPLVYIADSTKIEGDLTVSGSISGGALSISSITATGDAAISGDVSIGGSLTVSATTTLAVDGGYVGIATSTPSTNLAVAGNIMGSGNLVLYGSATSTIAGPITSGSIYPSLDVTYYLGSPSYRWANIYAATSTFGGTIVVGSDVIRGSSTTTLTTIGNSNQLVLGADGNVGIGTSTMSGLLTVGTSTPSLVVAANGYVGISTTTPSYALEVSGTVKTDDFITKGPWVDVRAFGAEGDGVADDTDAVNAALASLGTQGGTVYFPPGIYLVGDITVSQNSVIIQGAGRALSSGIATSTTEIRAKAGSTRSLYVTGNNVVIKDLYINGNSNAVQFEVNGPYCIIDNIYSSGHTQYQLNRNSTGVCRINNSSFIGQVRTISNAINITGNYFNGNGAVTALTVDGGANVVIHGNTFESYTTAIAMATSGASFVVSANITSNYFESSFDDNSSVVQIGHSSPSSYSVNILNNYFGPTDADYFINASYLESLVIQGNNFHGSPAVENINIGSGVNKLVGSTNRDGDAAGVLGVGTSTPRYLLDVWGDLAVGTSTDSNTPVLYVKSGTGYGSVGIGTTTPTGLLTVGTTTPALVVTDSGKVGIGTTTPTEALTVVGNIVGTGNITVTGDYVTLSGDIMPSSPQVSDIGSPAYDWANIYVNNVYANNILAASSSIAGTIAEMFTINSDAASDATSTLRFYRGTDTPHALLNWDAGYDRFNFNFPLYLSGTGAISSAGTLTLSSGGAGDILLNPAGNVGIATSSPSAKLAVTGNAMIDGDLSFLGDQTISGSGKLTINPTGNLELQSSANYIDESGNLIVSGRVDTDTLQYSGNITINATSSGATTVLVTNADGRAVADLQIEGDIQIDGGKITLATGETIDAETSDHVIITSGGTQVLDIISGGVSVTGNVTTTDRLYVTSGGADITGTVDITGNTEVTGALHVTATTTLDSSLVVDTDTLYVDSFTDKVGIGTSTPSGKLSVAGNILGSGNIVLYGSATSTIAGPLELASPLRTAGNIYPASDVAYTLGSPSHRWANIYAATGTFGGTITIDTDDIRATGALNLTGAAASTWQVSGGALTVQADSQNLTIKTLNSGNIAITSAGSLTETFGAAGEYSLIHGSTVRLAFDSSGNLMATGTTIAFTGDTTITGAATTTDDFSAQGNIWGSGNLVLSGTINTGQGATEVYLMNQDIQTTDAVTFTTVNTGHGDNELYAMDQAVRTTDSVTFGSLNLTYGLTSASSSFSGLISADELSLTYGASMATSTVTATSTAGSLAVGGSNLYVSENGRIGIGTTTPENLLHIVSASGSPQLRLSYDVANYGTIEAESDGDLAFTAKAGRYVRSYSAFVMGSDLYMGENTIQDIGAAGTDFSATGGLTLADVLTISSGGALITGNVGIGTTTPQYTLDVWGNANIGTSSDSELLVGGGYGKITVGTIDPPTGDLKIEVAAGSLSATASDDIYFATNDTERMRILSSGYIGIGTGSPDQLLTISDSESPVIRFERSAAGNADYEMYMSAGDLRFRGGANGTGVGLLDRVTFQYSGNVGIGNMNPSSKLTVNGGDIAVSSGAATTTISYNQSTFASNVVVSGTATSTIAGPLTVRTNQLVVNESGNVGIGTASPSLDLHIKKTVDGSVSARVENPSTGISAFAEFSAMSDGGVVQMIAYGDNYSDASRANTAFLSASSGLLGGMVFRTVGNAPLKFTAYEDGSATPDMTILAAGNVGIGTTNPSSKLTVSGGNFAISAAGTATSTIYGSTSATSTIISGLSAGNNAALVVNQTATANSLYVAADGNVGIGTANPGQGVLTTSFDVYRSDGYSNITLSGPATGTINANRSLRFVQGAVDQVAIGVAGSAGQFTGGTAAGDLVLMGTGDILFKTQGYGGTADMVIKSGYVGIGTTSPSHLLEVDGTSYFDGAITLTSGGQLQGTFSAGTGLTMPAFTMNADITGNNQDILGLQSISIGSNPATTGLVKLSNAGGGIRFRNSANDNNIIALEVNASDDVIIGHSGVANVIELQNTLNLNSNWISGDGDSEGIYIDSSGNVGIGTTTPSVALEIHRVSDSANLVLNSSGAGQNAIFFNDGSVKQTQFTSNFSDDKFYLYHQGGNRLVIDASGNIGIGTNGPSSKLTVFGGDVTVGDGSSTTTIASTGAITLGASMDANNLSITNLAGLTFSGGSNVYRDISRTATDGGLNLRGGTAAAGKGGAISLSGTGEVSAGTIRLFTPDAAATSDITRLNISGNLATAVASWSNITHTGLVLSGALDANNQLITNIGAAGTDFTAGGGLNIATNLAVTATTTSGTLNVGSGNLYVSENGNVGIGTTTPTELLTVESNSTHSTLTVKTYESSSNANIRINSGTSGTSQLWMGDVANNSIGAIEYTQSLNQFDFYTNGTNALTIDSSQRVGIGTVTPYAKLTINESDDFAFGSLNGNVVDNMDGTILTWLSSNAAVSTSTESSIVKTGSQSLKITASGASEDVTVKKTLSSAQNWSSYERIGFWIRVDRFATSTATSTQLISFQYHDTGGTTNTHNITFLEEDRWQYEEIALTSTAADKDAVDYVQFRPDFGGTGDINFYIDQIRVYDDDERAADFFVDKDGTLTITGRGGVEIYAPQAGAGQLPGVKVDSAVVEIGQPLSVNTGGNVGIAYDLEFLNTGASYITSEGQLRIEAGDPNHAENLVLTTRGTGDVIVELNSAGQSFMLAHAWDASTTVPFVLNSESNTSQSLFQVLSNTGASGGVTFAVMSDGKTAIGKETPYSMLNLASTSDFAFGDFNAATVDDMENAVLTWLSSNAAVSTSTETSVVRTENQSLKITASGASEDVTVKKTLSSAQNWSSYERIGFWIRVDRFATSTATSTQLISFQYHDTGGTTNTHNITFLEEDRWQYEEIALTSTAADKDAVDYVQFRPDFGGTGDINFYIDQIRVYDDDERAADFFVDKSGSLVITGRGSVELFAPQSGAGSLPGVKVDGAVVELGQPLSVNTGGNVGFDYDLEFLNTGLSQITSEGPLRIATGPSYRSHNLTLASGGTGDVIVELSQASSSMMIMQAAYATTTAFIINSETNATSTYLMKLFSDVNSDENGVFVINAAGQVGIGTSTPSYNLEVASGGSLTALLGTSASDEVLIGGGLGKLTTGNVDPPYFIDGVKYATYMAGMVGVKEETTGVITLADEDSDGTFSYTVDFVNEPEGSDLWLFSRTTDWGRNMKDLVVLVSPSQATARVWYQKDPINNKLIIYGNCACEVSYRLTAPRFDYSKFGNVHDRQDGVGFQPDNINFSYEYDESDGALTVEEENGGIIPGSEEFQVGLADLGLLITEYGTLEVDSLKTRKLCVGDICVTEDEFRAVFGAGAAEAWNASQTDVCTNGENQPCGYETCDFEQGECPGVCEIGVQVCEGGQWSSCMGSVMPSDELCDGVDNNCNGEIDEGGACDGITGSEEETSTTTDPIIEDSTSTDSIIDDSTSTDSIIDTTSTDTGTGTTTATTTDE